VSRLLDSLRKVQEERPIDGSDRMSEQESLSAITEAHNDHRAKLLLGLILLCGLALGAILVLLD
jgi:hypothetical protein